MIADSKEVVIKVENVTKEYVINIGGKKSYKQSFINLIKKQNEEKIKRIKIFNDVNFSINKGEVFGIIGENGAGKSTTLKMLAGIITPDKGKISVNGTVAALLEIGLAFHPDLTGVENARLYGSVLGVSRKKMMQIMGEVFKFAELEGYEQVPLKKYSSGMQVRLAFSVATIVDPDILLLDEVFSVGDQKFQEKSFSKINSFIEREKTVLLVTHDLGIVEEMCTRVLYLEKRGAIHIGNPKDMIRLYHEKIDGGN